MISPKMLTSYDFEHPIACHAFNKDQTQVALCYEIAGFTEDAYDIWIYDVTKPKPLLLAKLKKHNSNVRCIDWAPISNQIVSCSTDMNTFVWKQDDQKNWVHVTVQAKLRFSASFCKFSPNEQYIAVGSASGKLRVCTYIGDYDWWGEKRLKDLTSAILSIAWTPDSCYIAVGCADRFFKIYTINPHTPKHTFSLTSPGYGFSSCVGFNSSSTHAFLYSTDSQITIFDISNMSAPKHTSTLINTPLMSSVQFIGEKLLVGSSSDKLFYLLEIQADHSVKVLKSFGEFVRAQQKLSARQTFVSLDKRGTTAATGSSASKTFHTKHISKIQMHDNKFSASSFDKKISIWSY